MRNSVRPIWNGIRPVMGPERPVTVREVAGIFPEKVADKRLGSGWITGRLHVKMLQFSGNPPEIEGAVGAPHSLQINRHDAQPFTEQEIAGRGVAMHKHLPVLPHASACPARDRAANAALRHPRLQ